ncbi:MAG TPA: RDD family protein [Ilumatobacter sp.]
MYQQHPTYAGWWRRVGAAIIDALIAWVFLLPGTIVAGGDSDAGTSLGPLLTIAGFVAYVVIYCRMLGRGATWGRQAAGYRIVDERTGQPIGTGRAVGRYFASILSGLPCYLGFLWPLWDSENRTFHDMIVRTRAVRS